MEKQGHAYKCCNMHGSKRPYTALLSGCRRFTPASPSPASSGSVSSTFSTISPSAQSASSTENAPLCHRNDVMVKEGAKCKAPNQVHKSLDYDNLASEVMTAVVREDMASAKTSLERMNLLGHPGSPLSITGSLVGATCHAFLSLCQRRHRQTRGGTGLGEALHILSLQNLASSFDMACTRLLFSLLPTSHHAQWSTTVKALDLAFANLPAVAYPSQSLKRTALRQFAEAGRPEEVRWLLPRMQEPFLAVSSKTSKGARSRQREKKREIGKESHPPSLG